MGTSKFLSNLVSIPMHPICIGEGHNHGKGDPKEQKECIYIYIKPTWDKLN
jgi:hypothetical protein